MERFPPGQAIPGLQACTRGQRVGLCARDRQAALPGRAAKTLGTGPAQLTRMQRMSGEEVVAVSQHESSRSNEVCAFFFFFFLVLIVWTSLEMEGTK